MPYLKEILGEELFNQVNEKLGDNKIAVVSDGAWIPKSKFDEINEQKNTYKGQIDTLNGQIKDFEKSAKGNDELLAQIEKFKGDNEDLNGKIKDITLDSAIKLGLVNNKAKYADLLAGKIDKSKLQLDDKGNVTGLDEQIKTLQEGYKDLFEPTAPVTPPIPGSNPPGANNNPNNVNFKEVSQADFQKELSKYGINRLY